MEFDENKLVRHISASLAEAGRPAYSDDEILNIVDMIWDFYDTRGLLDPDVEEEPDRQEIEPDIVAYCATLLRRDKSARVVSGDLPLIVKAELDYEDMVLDGSDNLTEE
ncbi:MAG: hypothetical protein NC342_01855 [Pseudoflavonifractor sp.]|nr:hypothetical protein [Alloprevotella sp.]MCM1116268.1 hypothetical protein [Pseudoflavonifractor sp.]